MLVDFFRGIYNTALIYSVNPIIFISIYVVSIPVFYYPLIKLAQSVKEKPKNKNKIKKNIFRAIIICTLAWISPYFYVLVFGRNLPPWFVFLIVVFAIITGVYTFLERKSKFFK